MPEQVKLCNENGHIRLKFFKKIKSKQHSLLFLTRETETSFFWLGGEAAKVQIRRPKSWKQQRRSSCDTINNTSRCTSVVFPYLTVTTDTTAPVVNVKCNCISVPNFYSALDERPSFKFPLRRNSCFTSSYTNKRKDELYNEYERTWWFTQLLTQFTLSIIWFSHKVFFQYI